ncbi:MAG: GNAT family N-acetyltransferase [Anaerolineae bacterium]|nr:GNAT family N-acetyltransferase [Anaerolineae bacterium]
MIQSLEERALNAWPALQVVLYDGWVLRFAEGYTKRANSVSPLYASGEDVEEKIRRCEHFYRRRGQDAIFKLTEASLPEGLNDILAQKGYVVDAPTSVQTVDLDNVDVASRTAHLEMELTEEWLSNQCRLGKIADQQRLIQKQILRNIVPPTCYVSIEEGGGVVSCGMGVLEGEILGIFDVVTDEQHRRRGYGIQMMLNLLWWGKRNGATTAYLAVMLDNPPALRLYEKLGFREVYQYWYRVKK